MLQIATKRYFRPDAPLHATLQRGVFYTNRAFLGTDPVALALGELAPSSGIEGITSVAVSAMEHLESEDANGQPGILIATSGADLLDDLAYVLSFGLNSTFTRDIDLIRRLVPSSLDNLDRSSPAKIFRQTFDPGRVLLQPELDAFNGFFRQLLDLRRPEYERAMRAVRRLVRATQRASEDPTVAYTDMVAALESLSVDVQPPAPDWTRVDGRLRNRVDSALEGVDEAHAAEVRDAIVDGKRAGSYARFAEFVRSHLEPAYFRDEAVGAVRPLRALDLDITLKSAYAARSQSVHSLADLPQELWVLGTHTETVAPVGESEMLTLEGLARLARHTIRNYVMRGPTGIDPSFNWRERIPGQLTMRFAPQYWIGRAAGYSADSASAYFWGFCEHLAEQRLAGEAIVDMRDVLEIIERELPGRRGAERVPMLGLYALWDAVIVPDGRREDADALLKRRRRTLGNPSMVAFAVTALLGRPARWTVEEWVKLAETRTSARIAGADAEIPGWLDTALYISTANALLAVGDQEQAQAWAETAVGETPGNQNVRRWEEQLRDGGAVPFDLTTLLQAPNQDGEAAERPT